LLKKTEQFFLSRTACLIVNSSLTNRKFPIIGILYSPVKAAWTFSQTAVVQMLDEKSE
jgi:hypothetical protein